MRAILICLVLLVTAAFAEVYFEETFSDGEDWRERWVISKNKADQAGALDLSPGKYYDSPNNKGLKTMDDLRFYQFSAKMKEFTNRGKTLVIQFSVKHEQGLDCGGGYLKILPAGLNQDDFSGDSTYNIMFGPDQCGSTKRVHFIFNYKGKNHLIEDEIFYAPDTLTHLYTAIINPDQTYQVLVDNEEKKKGSLLTDWKFLPEKEIPDPSVSKPKDWVDQEMIDDPTDKKPEGWDDIPKSIPDPDAKKPDDWDEELDGAWEAPVIDNPQYKGRWSAKQIKNPDYKGPWVHPKIANPDYKEDKEIYVYASNAYVGVEIWQVKAGTIFDNFLITDDPAYAKKRAEEVLVGLKAEKAMKDADKPAAGEEDEGDHDDHDHDHDDNEEPEKIVHDEL